MAWGRWQGCGQGQACVGEEVSEHVAVGCAQRGVAMEVCVCVRGCIRVYRVGVGGMVVWCEQNMLPSLVHWSPSVALLRPSHDATAYMTDIAIHYRRRHNHRHAPHLPLPQPQTLSATAYMTDPHNSSSSPSPPPHRLLTQPQTLNHHQLHHHHHPTTTTIQQPRNHYLVATQSP